MSGVIVSNGELGFTPEYTLEWAVLSRGVEGARKHIKKTRKKMRGGDLKASMEMDKIPVIVPTSREETYERAYALIREAGQGVGIELKRMEYPSGEINILKDSFMSGFLDTAFDRKDREDQHIGVARLFYACGRLVTNLLISIFPEKKGEPTPDTIEPINAFWRGVADERREIEWLNSDKF
jgi:hypothetical protein